LGDIIDKLPQHRVLLRQMSHHVGDDAVSMEFVRRTDGTDC
jgi:hypothetical protein